MPKLCLLVVETGYFLLTSESEYLYCPANREITLPQQPKDGNITINIIVKNKQYNKKIRNRIDLYMHIIIIL